MGCELDNKLVMIYFGIVKKFSVFFRDKEWKIIFIIVVVIFYWD